MHLKKNLFRSYILSSRTSYLLQPFETFRAFRVYNLAPGIFLRGERYCAKVDPRNKSAKSTKELQEVANGFRVFYVLYFQNGLQVFSVLFVLYFQNGFKFSM